MYSDYCDTPTTLLLYSCMGSCSNKLLHNFCCFVSIFIVKMPKMKGNKTIYSSQEATQLIFMNSDSEGENVELGEDFGEDSEKDSDWKPEEEDIDYQTAEGEKDICSERPPKK